MGLLNWLMQFFFPPDIITTKTTTRAEGERRKQEAEWRLKNN